MLNWCPNLSIGKMLYKIMNKQFNKKHNNTFTNQYSQPEWRQRENNNTTTENLTESIAKITFFQLTTCCINDYAEFAQSFLILFFRECHQEAVKKILIDEEKLLQPQHAAYLICLSNNVMLYQCGSKAREIGGKIIGPGSVRW